MRIFLSYTMRDGVLSVSKLQKLESLLSKYGNPYIDLLHNTSPRPQSYVISMLEQSSVFCAYLTNGFLKSEWVQLELKIAQRNNIPILWIDASFPNIETLKGKVTQNKLSNLAYTMSLSY